MPYMLKEWLAVKPTGAGRGIGHMSSDVVVVSSGTSILLSPKCNPPTGCLTLIVTPSLIQGHEGPGV